MVQLDALRGKWVLLYFFPKAGTTGCTTQACAVRDLDTLTDLRVFGASPDHPDSLEVFRQAFRLGFSLLSDPALELARRYRVVDGILTARIERTTFLIDPAGVVARVARRVDPERQAEQIQRWLEQR